MGFLDHASSYLDALSVAVKRIRFVALVGGVGLTGVGSYFRTSSVQWQADVSDTLFWVGLAVLLLMNLLLVFVDKQAVETLKSLHEQEKRTGELEDRRVELEQVNIAFAAWLSLIKLLSELTDQAMATKEAEPETKRRLLNAAVEFIVEYKTRLFGIGDDYLNVSIYEYVASSESLECVACYRSRSSDAVGPHRSWRSGEGHVGKAFERQTELVCGDARAPDVASWIAAPPDKFQDDDPVKYVSLAAIPIAIRADDPLGVIIMSSDQPHRFVSRDQEPGDFEQEQGQFAVGALQDIAAQLAQLMFILAKHNSDRASGGEHDD